MNQYPQPKLPEMPSQEVTEKQIKDMHSRQKSEFMKIIIPEIEEGTPLSVFNTQRLLLRQIAAEPSYDVNYIKTTLIKNEQESLTNENAANNNKDYKCKLLKEIATNPLLRRAMSYDDWFSEWFMMANRYAIQ